MKTTTVVKTKKDIETAYPAEVAALILRSVQSRVESLRKKAISFNDELAGKD